MIKQLFLFTGFVFITLVGTSNPNVTDPKTDPKDSAAVKKENHLKGFKNLFTSDVFNPAEPYKLQINPKAVPYIDEYIDKHREHLETMKIWGRPYFRMMDNILESYGIPKELKYLAVIESNLENAALSRVGARGPWQFMPETGRLMGLVVNEYRDERTDYYKSTHAAAKYLKILYNQLGQDWLLVIAGYNGGPGRVLNAIKRTGSRDFWVLQNSLPLESRNHVKKFIGTHYVMEGTGGLTTVTNGELAQLHKDAIENNKLQLTKGMTELAQLRASMPAELLEGATKLTIQGKYNSVVLSNYLGIDVAFFNQLNPHFDRLVPEENGYEMYLPTDKMERFNAQRYVILQQSIMALLSGMNSGNEVFPEIKPRPVAPVVRKKA